MLENRSEDTKFCRESCNPSGFSPIHLQFDASIDFYTFVSRKIAIMCNIDWAKNADENVRRSFTAIAQLPSPLICGLDTAIVSRRRANSHDLTNQGNSSGWITTNSVSTITRRNCVADRPSNEG